MACCGIHIFFAKRRSIDSLQASLLSPFLSFFLLLFTLVSVSLYKVGANGKKWQVRKKEERQKREGIRGKEKEKGQKEVGPQESRVKTSSMKWSNAVKKSRPNSPYNDVRDAEHHYFKLMLLKVVLQATDASGILYINGCFFTDRYTNFLGCNYNILINIIS